jgi:uncharacterized protein (TIGR02145 family)
MRRQLTKIALAASFMFALAFTLSCSGDSGSEPPPHVHDWGEWVMTTAPACTADGVETRICAGDETHTETQSVAQLEWRTVTIPATCETVGEQTRTCTDSETHVQTQPIAQLEWKWTVTTPATPTTAREETGTCTDSETRTRTRQIYNCKGVDYDPAEKFCYNDSKVADYCGTRTETYNPDLYECKSSINPNGIYLKIKPKDANGKEYKAVLIGEQTWMAENLNYAVPDSKCGGTEVIEVYNGITLYSFVDGNTINCDAYGRLYDWATAMALDASCNSDTDCSGQINANHRGICPIGWHVPSIDEWEKLNIFTGDIVGWASGTAGTKLKSAGGWNIGNGYIPGTDDYGFSALPGGGGEKATVFGDVFYNVGNRGFWWNATEYIDPYDGNRTYASNILMYNSEEHMEKNTVSAKSLSLYSIRCVMD